MRRRPEPVTDDESDEIAGSLVAVVRADPRANHYDPPLAWPASS